VSTQRVGFTHTYASPEQLRGDGNITHRSDIYSWAIVVLELLMRGCRLWEGQGMTPYQYLEHLVENQNFIVPDSSFLADQIQVLAAAHNIPGVPDFDIGSTVVSSGMP